MTETKNMQLNTFECSNLDPKKLRKKTYNFVVILKYATFVQFFRSKIVCCCKITIFLTYSGASFLFQ